MTWVRKEYNIGDAGKWGHCTETGTGVSFQIWE